MNFQSTPFDKLRERKEYAGSKANELIDAVLSLNTTSRRDVISIILYDSIRQHTYLEKSSA